MARRHVGTLIDRKAINNINDNFKELFDELVSSGVDAADAKEKALQAALDASVARKEAEEAREIVQQIINESFDTGALNANIEGKLNKLEAEYAPKLDTVSQQMVTTDNNSFYKGITMTKQKKAQLVFVDDDCRSDVLTQLKPIVEQEKIPITLAAITQYPSNVDGTGSWLSLEQLKDLQRLGFEIVSHTHTHKRLGDLTDEEVHYELSTSKKWLQDNGFNHNILVYPYGSFSGKQHIVSQYYQAAIRTDYGEHRLNRPPILQMQLERVYFNYETGTNDIETCKQKIDEAVENDELIIIGMHCHYQNFDQEGLIEVIRHAKIRGIEIVTAQEAINNYGNIIDLPGFKIGADGEIESSSVGTHRIVSNTSANVSITGETPITEFKHGSTVNIMSTGSYSGLPVSSAGTLYTFRAQSDYLSYQEFQVWYNKRIYRRVGESGGAWGEWYGIYNPNDPKIYDLTNNTVNGTTPLEDFELGITRTVHSNSSGYQGMPVSSGTVMYTHRLRENNYSYQEARPIHSVGQTYIRFYQSSAWGEWFRVSPQTSNYNESFEVGTLSAGETKVKSMRHANWTSDKSYNISPKTPIPNGVILDNYFDVDENRIYLRATNVTQESKDVGTIKLHLAVT